MTHITSSLLTGNTLKIIAAISMLIDHIGVLFFPTEPIFRIIGRIAFPIFAFMISEGARYTRNKLKHFIMMGSLALLCQIVYYIVDKSLYMCIIVTFSISTLLIYAMQKFKKVIFSDNSNNYERIFWSIIFFGGVIGTYLLNEVLMIDYGFIGCITPLLASLFDFKDISAPDFCKKLDTIPMRVLCMIPALIGLILRNNLWVQYFCLISIPLLLLYSGKRGSAKLKYFFYIFYPLHLALLYGIAILIFIFK